MRTLLIVLAAMTALWLASILALAIAGRRMAARQLLRSVPDLLALLRGLLRDPRVPRGSKVLVGIAAVWVLSPIDLIPEFLPILGPLDDIVVVLLVLRHLLKHTGAEVITEHWRGDPRVLERAIRTASMGRRGRAVGSE